MPSAYFLTAKDSCLPCCGARWSPCRRAAALPTDRCYLFWSLYSPRAALLPSLPVKTGNANTKPPTIVGGFFDQLQFADRLLCVCSGCGLVRRIYAIVQNKNKVWRRGSGIYLTSNERVICLIVLCGNTIVNVTFNLANNR